MRENPIENRYIGAMDADKTRKDRSVPEQGRPAEQLTSDFFTQSGFDTRFTSESEDEGTTNIGSKKIIDAVVYRSELPVMALQITTSEFRSIREKKLAEIRNKPFIRLDEMKSKDVSIPRVLVYMDAARVKKFSNNPDFNQNPELSIQILDSTINSLKFDLLQTKNPLEQKAVKDLIVMLEQEKKKYIH